MQIRPGHSSEDKTRTGLNQQSEASSWFGRCSVDIKRLDWWKEQQDQVLGQSKDFSHEGNQEMQDKSNGITPWPVEKAITYRQALSYDKIDTNAESKEVNASGLR